MGQVKKIRIQVKNLYMLEVDGCGAMMGKAEKVVSRDEGELWHRQLSHLHNVALNIMQQISIGLPRGTLAQLDQCKGCTLGNYVKSTFHEKENRASVIPERIHTDVCGPFLVASTTKHRYYVILLMNFLVNDGYSSCRRRIKHSQSSVSIGGERVREASEISKER
jgi:hypothetical protein